MTGREYMKIEYEYRKAHHLCTKCERELPEGWKYVMCDKCQAERRAYYKGYRDLCRKLGRCISCGRLIGDKGHSTCTVCREKMKIRTRERRARCKKMNSDS